MKFSTLLFISIRYTMTKSSDAFVSFISKTSTIGLILGIAVLIIVLSVMNGFSTELQNRILGSIPHAVLSHRGTLDNWRDVANEVSNFDGVDAVAPLNHLEAVLFSDRGGSSSFSLINGISPSEETRVSNIPNNMSYGRIEDLNHQPFGIILGSSLAFDLQVHVGDYVSLVLPKVVGSIAGFAPVFKRFQVIGIFNTNSQIDSVYSFIHITDAARLTGIPTDAVRSLRIKFNDVLEAPILSRNLRFSLDSISFSIRDWTYSYGNLFSAIQLEKRMIGLLLFFIILVAAFNVLATLVMIVQEKRTEVAILRTMGAGVKDIIMIFMLQGTWIGIAGCLLGSLLGVVGAYYISSIIYFIESLFGIRFLDANTYFISYLPSEIWLSDILTVILFAFSICILSTIYPSWRATKIYPAEMLKA